MPIRPNEQAIPQQPGQLPGGKLYLATNPRHGSFVVEVEPFPHVPNDQEYQQLEQKWQNASVATNLYGASAKLEVKSSTKTEILGMPGRDLVTAVTMKQGSTSITVEGKLRLVFTGKWLISMQAIIPPNPNASGSSETIFHNSFRRVSANGPNLQLGANSLAASPGSPDKPATNTVLSLSGQIVRSSDRTVAVNLPSIPAGDPEKKQAMGTECLIRDLKGDINGRFVFAEYSLPLGKTTRDMVLALVDEPIPGVKSPGAVRKRDISLEGRPTFDIEFDQGTDVHKAKIVGYGSKVYVLFYTGPKEKAKEKPVVDFLRSFRAGPA